MATLMQMKAQLLRAFKLISLTTYKKGQKPSQGSLTKLSPAVGSEANILDSDHVELLRSCPGVKGASGNCDANEGSTFTGV